MGSAMRKVWLTVLAPALFLSTPASAVGPLAKPPDFPRLFGSFAPKAGVWAEYSVLDKDSGKKSKMRMSVVAQEGESYWYEVVQEDGSARNVIKMLVKGNPNEPDNIQRQIIKSGDAPAIEMDREFVVMGRRMASQMFERRAGVPAEAQAGLKVEKAEPREVTVPAGTFKAALHRIVDAEGKVLATYDSVPEILPFGVITSDTSNTHMELLAYGSDAKSVITEQPVPMKAPLGMPSDMPRGMPLGFEQQGKQAEPK